MWRQRPRTIKRAQRRTRRGAVMLEMALVLPLFLITVLGIVEFGQVLLVSHLLTNAARDGARMASFPGSTGTAVEASVEQFLEQTANIDPGEVTVTITIDEAVGNPDTADLPEDAHRRDGITVQAEVTFSQVSWMSPFFLSDTKTLSGRCIMRHE